MKPADLLDQLRPASCDLRTLAALAAAVGYTLAVAPAREPEVPFGRAREEELLDLCASGNHYAATWRQHGGGFFMGGLATMLASMREFDRRQYLALAEELHPGVTLPEVFELWFEKSPVRPARFLPMLKRWKPNAAVPSEANIKAD